MSEIAGAQPRPDLARHPDGAPGGEDVVLGRLRRALEVMTEVVAAVPGDRWEAPSPCEAWTARHVVGHVIGTLGKAAETVRGAEYGGTPMDPAAAAAGDPVRAWGEAVSRLRDALNGADLHREVDSPRGRKAVVDALRLPIADLSVHAWDLGAAVGLPVRLPDELLAHVRELTSSVHPEQLRSPGFFGAEVSAPEGADETERLMAYLGRVRPGVAR